MPEWRSRAVEVVLPAALVQAMWRRAKQLDADAGGRFDERGAAVLIWSAPLGPDDDRAAPIGVAYVRWHTPGRGDATIWKLEWDEAAGGSEAEVWSGLEILAGRPIPREP
jgi:hypothetical protein